MDIGFALPHYDFSFPDRHPATVQRTVKHAVLAESLGFESVWVSDHLFLDLARYGGPTTRFAALEPFTALAAVAAQTTRVRMGTLVACAPFRPALLLANMADTLHGFSGGRFELGVGAGWYQAEFDAADIPFGTAGERLAALGEYLRGLDEHLPKDPRPPVFVGGKGGPKVMRLVAQGADGWNIVWRVTPQTYRERLAVLRAACEAEGRDPGGVMLTVGLTTLVGSDRRDLKARYERLRAWAPGGALDDVPLETFADGGLVGTPEEVTETVAAFAELGVSRLIISLANVPFALASDEDLTAAAEALIR